jgi:hypothetical protein
MNLSGLDVTHGRRKRSMDFPNTKDHVRKGADIKESFTPSQDQLSHNAIAGHIQDTPNDLRTQERDNFVAKKKKVRLSLKQSEQIPRAPLGENPVFPPDTAVEGSFAITGSSSRAPFSSEVLKIMEYRAQGIGWAKMAKLIPGRTAAQINSRYHGIKKLEAARLKGHTAKHKKRYTEEEDKIILRSVGQGKPWSEIGAELGRVATSCAQHFYNTLSRRKEVARAGQLSVRLAEKKESALSRMPFTPAQDNMILQGVEQAKSSSEIGVEQERVADSCRQRYYKILRRCTEDGQPKRLSTNHPKKRQSDHPCTAFTPEEDEKLRQGVKQKKLYSDIGAELGRSATSCAQRFRNHLRHLEEEQGISPENHFKPYSLEEDEIILHGVQQKRKFSEIGAELKRTAYSCGQRYRKRLRRLQE